MSTHPEEQPATIITGPTPPVFSWYNIAQRSARYVGTSPLTVAALTLLWWVMPHPLLVHLPSPGEVEGLEIVRIGVASLGVLLLWLVAAVGFRTSFARFAGEGDAQASGRAGVSSQLLHFLLALGTMWGIAALATLFFLVVFGFIILPASRVDGPALFTGYVAPIIAAVVVLFVRARYALGVESPLQHNERARRGLRNGVLMFREHRLVVLGMIVAVHLFYAVELGAASAFPDSVMALEIAGVVAAILRSALLVVWLSFYHEIRATTQEELV